MTTAEQRSGIRVVVKGPRCVVFKLDDWKGFQSDARNQTRSRTLRALSGVGLVIQIEGGIEAELEG